MEDQERPEPEEQYDHTVRKPKNAGLAMVFGLIIPGAGQFIKGHFARAAAIWALVTLGILGSRVAAGLGEVSLSAIFKIVIGLIWIYSLWDAVSRPEDV